MTRTRLFALGLPTGILVATILLTATLSGQGTGQTTSATPDDPTTGLFVQMCNECHNAARIVAQRRTRADWEDELNKMIEKGAAGSEKDFETVFAYLLRNYGKVAVNLAPPDEIAAVLSVSSKEAEAIVDFRKANGAFKDLEALKKVPNVDVKKLDEHKDAVVF
jgi:competence protein ComEA